MDQFSIFLQQGFFHILDFNGYDHILFLFAICATFSQKDWKQLLWIITSFTIAHSISFALSVIDIVAIAPDLIEFFIAFTIVFTCVENIALKRLHRFKMTFSFIFGLIHGLGFSRMLKDLFMGMEFNLLSTLLPFNLGLEASQLIIISVIIGFIFLLRNIAGLNSKMVNYIISIPVGVQAVIWMVQRWPF